MRGFTNGGHIANDVCNCVRKFHSPQKLCVHWTYHRLLNLFPSKRPINFRTIAVCGLPSKTKTRNKLIFIMLFLHVKLTKAIPSRATTETEIVQLFLKERILLYGTLELVLPDSCPQYVEEFHNAAIGTLGTKLMTTIAFHPQARRKTKRLSYKIIGRLWRYVRNARTAAKRLCNRWHTLISAKPMRRRNWHHTTRHWQKNRKHRQNLHVHCHFCLTENRHWWRKN